MHYQLKDTRDEPEGPQRRCIVGSSEKRAVVDNVPNAPSIGAPWADCRGIRAHARVLCRLRCWLEVTVVARRDNEQPVRYYSTVSRPDFQRARTWAHKQERVAELLAAARVVVARVGVKSATLTSIAAEAGLHYSALRRYFTSTDAMLLILAADGWEYWAHRIHGRLAGQTLDAEQLAEILVQTLTADRVFCDLLCNLRADLEMVDEKEWLTAHLHVVRAVTEVVGSAQAAVPGITGQVVEDLLAAVAAFVVMPQMSSLAAPGLEGGAAAEPGSHWRGDMAVVYRLVGAIARGVGAGG